MFWSTEMQIDAIAERMNETEKHAIRQRKFRSTLKHPNVYFIERTMLIERMSHNMSHFMLFTGC